MTAYRYKIWKNILTKTEYGKVYTVKQDRLDYEDFVAALKSFSRSWWNFLVMNENNVVTFVMLDPVKCCDEMIGMYDVAKDKPVSSIDAPRDTFYTKVYEGIENKKESLTEPVIKSEIPGTPSSPDIVEKIMNERKNKTNEKKRKSK